MHPLLLSFIFRTKGETPEESPGKECRQQKLLHRALGRLASWLAADARVKNW